jgi:hypothetical protein
MAVFVALQSRRLNLLIHHRPEFFLRLPPHLPKAPLTLPLQCMHSVNGSTSTAHRHLIPSGQQTTALITLAAILTVFSHTQHWQYCQNPSQNLPILLVLPVPT